MIIAIYCPQNLSSLHGQIQIAIFLQHNVLLFQSYLCNAQKSTESKSVEITKSNSIKNNQSRTIKKESDVKNARFRIF